MTTAELPNILNFTPESLREKFRGLNIEAYRADQVFQWIFEKGVYDLDRMTNLSVGLREKLKSTFLLKMPSVADRQLSGDDKSTKLLLRLSEKDYVETVYIPAKDRRTVCVSSQVGCKFHCVFCASGQDGFFRNLTSAEIISQVLLAEVR